MLVSRCSAGVAASNIGGRCVEYWSWHFTITRRILACDPTYVALQRCKHVLHYGFKLCVVWFRWSYQLRCSGISVHKPFFTCHALRFFHVPCVAFDASYSALQRAKFERTSSDAALHAQNWLPRKCAPRCSAGRACAARCLRTSGFSPATVASTNAARARSCSSRPRARAFCFRRRQRRRQHRSARDVPCAHVGPAGVYPADNC